MCVLYTVFPLQFYQHPSYVQRSFSARKIVENNECRTSNHRAQHEAKKEHLNINGKVSSHSFSTESKKSVKVTREYWSFREDILLQQSKYIFSGKVSISSLAK